jgi:hypothetical protein
VFCNVCKPCIDVAAGVEAWADSAALGTSARVDARAAKARLLWRASPVGLETKAHRAGGFVDSNSSPVTNLHNSTPSNTDGEHPGCESPMEST